jgi:hypothetical protein
MMECLLASQEVMRVKMKATKASQEEMKAAVRTGQEQIKA